MSRRPTALITAGGTAEPIDDVRVLANVSTGRFGAALARALLDLGAEVTVLASERLAQHPEWLPTPIRVVSFRSAADLDARLSEALATPPDLLLMAAAVADYRPQPAAGKIQSDASHLQLHLERVPKILRTLRARCGARTRIVGFKLLSGASPTTLQQVARAQVEANALDLCVANDLSELGGPAHPVWLVARDQVHRLEGTRAEVAAAVAERLLPVDQTALALPGLDGPTWGRVHRWVRLPAALSDAPVCDGPVAPWLARHARPHAPVTLAEPNGALRIGLAPGDVSAWRGWLRDLPDSAWPIVIQGSVVGGWIPGPTPELTLLPHAETWLDAILALPQLQTTTRLRCASDARLIARGFSRDPNGVLRPPWCQPDARRAASVALLHGPTGRVLLGLRQRGAMAGSWAFPGGRCHEGEPHKDAALRELKEETGISLRWNELHLLGEREVFPGGSPPYLLTCTLAASFTAPEPVPSPELKASWIHPADAIHLPLAPGVAWTLHTLERAATQR